MNKNFIALSVVMMAGLVTAQVYADEFTKVEKTEIKTESTTGTASWMSRSTTFVYDNATWFWKEHQKLAIALGVTGLSFVAFVALWNTSLEFRNWVRSSLGMPQEKVEEHTEINTRYAYIS